MTLRRVVSFALAFAFAVAASSSLALAAGKPAPSGKVNVNTATVQQLAELPGVGGKLAARIVEYRQKSGSFKSVHEMVNVRGIGEKSLTRIEPYLTTGDAPARSAAK
jgi:competence protein ComEA